MGLFSKFSAVVKSGVEALKARFSSAAAVLPEEAESSTPTNGFNSTSEVLCETPPVAGIPAAGVAAPFVPPKLSLMPSARKQFSINGKPVAHYTVDLVTAESAEQAALWEKHGGRMVEIRIISRESDNLIPLIRGHIAALDDPKINKLPGLEISRGSFQPDGTVTTKIRLPVTATEDYSNSLHNLVLGVTHAASMGGGYAIGDFSLFLEKLQALQEEGAKNPVLAESLLYIEDGYSRCKPVIKRDMTALYTTDESVDAKWQACYNRIKENMALGAAA